MEQPVADHVYYHLDNVPKINLKLEKNSRGCNWEITILNCKSADEAMAMLKDAEAKMAASYGGTAV